MTTDGSAHLRSPQLRLLDAPTAGSTADALGVREGSVPQSYAWPMTRRIPVDRATSLAWVEIAHGARLHNRILGNVPDPINGAEFAVVDALYPYERASIWHRSYLNAALEHLLVWADLVAPLRFHPEQELIHTLRPAYTLSRAALEAASQAVWVSAGGSAAAVSYTHLTLPTNREV